MNLETATSMLYEDESLIGDLVDDEAQTLLKWAENQLPALLAQHPDDAAFDEAFQTLRSMVKGMNRFVGRRQELEATEKAERLAKLAEASSQLGFQGGSANRAQTATDMSAVAARQTAAPTNLDALHDLIRSIAPAAAPVEGQPAAGDPGNNTGDSPVSSPASSATSSTETSDPASPDTASTEPASSGISGIFSVLKDLLNDKKEQ